MKDRRVSKGGSLETVKGSSLDSSDLLMSAADDSSMPAPSLTSQMICFPFFSLGGGAGGEKELHVYVWSP